MRTDPTDERTDPGDDRPELRKHGYITTFTGARFDYSSPGPFRIRDVARSLSYTARFRGHTRFFYSVAQHSLYVSRLMGDRGYDRIGQAAGLLHDAHEAYVGDVPTPLKWACPEIAELERGLAIALRVALLPEANEYDFARSVKEFDDAALHAEAAALLEFVPPWVLQRNLPPVVEWDPAEVEIEFLRRAAELGIA